MTPWIAAALVWVVAGVALILRDLAHGNCTPRQSIGLALAIVILGPLFLLFVADAEDRL